MREREEVCFEAGKELTAWKKQCVAWKRCLRGWCRNLLRERPEIGGKRVPNTRRSISERAIGEFELGYEWGKRETEMIGWSSFASGFDIDKLAKLTGLRFMKEIVGNELKELFDLEPMKWFKCRSDTRVLGSACDFASEFILNLLKAFYLGGGQYVIKGIAVVESWMNKSGGNSGGSTVVYSVADAPKRRSTYLCCVSN